MTQRRENHLKATYGLTREDFEAMMEVQEGVCAICGLEDRRRRSDNTSYPLCVDHCHKSGHLRGLLCGRCNMAIGLFRDDPSVILRAVEYLKLHGSVGSDEKP